VGIQAGLDTRSAARHRMNVGASLHFALRADRDIQAGSRAASRHRMNVAVSFFCEGRLRGIQVAEHAQRRANA
jgi:hypothetical protein